MPSHGTDVLGQRYAYDLLVVDQRPGVHFHPAGSVRGQFLGGRTHECYAWGAGVHAPFDGEVVRAADGVPHLHFQLVDSPDLMSARGIACAFRAYEVERDGTWIRVTNGIPDRRERIRSIEPATGGAH